MDSFEKEISSALEPFLKEEPTSEGRCARGAARTLLVATLAPSELLRDIESLGHICEHADSIDAAAAMINSDRFELVLIDAALASTAAELLKELAERAPSAKIVLFSNESTAESVVNAMRLGAVDFLHTPVPLNELRERFDAALEKSRLDQRRENRLVRLKAICEELNEARREIAEQLDSLCRELVSAYEGMNEQMSDVAMASEFRTLIRQELDIEDLLRTALEYALTKTGPTNAAVFLSEGGGRYSLGAYVNYDCPRETIAEVLEHLGGAICPQMARESDIVSFEDGRDFAKWLDIESGMLAESQVITFSCMHEDECLAVIVLFRSTAKPYNEELTHAIETLRPIFASQLANVMRIHHRALPSWPKEARGEPDEYDFDDPRNGYGFGGLAA